MSNDQSRVAGSGQEVLVSVDVETAGPSPSRYSLLSIGACLVDDPARTFYVELKPVTADFEQTALDVSGLSMEALTAGGTAPAAAMLSFEQWLAREVPPGSLPVFTAFNVGFDWMFVHDYFHRYVGRNPFGHSALDIKAYYMGMAGSSWAGTSMRHLAPRYLGDRQLSHNALDDAVQQAKLFRAIRADGLSRQHAEQQGRQP